mgnify:CR=1 FL=1
MITKKAKLTRVLKNLYFTRNEPISLVHFLTNRCNARCSFCFIDFDDPKTFANELSLDEISKLTKNLGKSLLNINFTGGEPFARKEINEIADLYIKNTTIQSMYITTNGSLPDRTISFAKNVINKYKHIELTFQISIDDAPEKHNAVRKVKHLFDNCGIIHIGKDKIGYDEVFEIASNSGAKDCHKIKNFHEVITAKEDFYKIKTELSIDDYNVINNYCNKKNITWFASCWDIQSVKDLHDFNLPCYKIASASITDLKLLSFVSSKKKPIFMSTGMSSEKQIKAAYDKIKKNPNIIMHCNSEYPSKYQDLNLKYINQLKKRFKKSIIGYSGHEISLIPTVAAVVLGAKVIERHITLDKSLWGSDHSCSLEPLGLSRLVKEIRVIEKSLGLAKKVITPGEKMMIKKLRKFK